MRSLALPLLLYVGMTVVVPLVNGAPRDRAFVEHSVLVLGAVALVAMITRAR